MNGYRSWNDALAKRFFNPETAGRPVYLFVTKEVITEVGAGIGNGYGDFLAAVRGGPPGATRLGHCQRALQVGDSWRDRELEYPPYVGYLALFVLAAGHEGDYAPQAYYPRLWSLLGENRTGTLPSFDRMFELWDDLEKWSVHDRGGELGVFEARIVGGKIHIGLPLAQTMLTASERDALPHVFSSAGLDPGRTANSRELCRALALHGSGCLRQHTVRALNHGSETFREALLDAAAEDFSSWDGSVPTSTGDRAAGSAVAGLRLCLTVDRVARTVKSTVRIFARREYPDDLLKITGLSSEALECAEFYDGWSTALKLQGSDFEPGPASWTYGLAGTDARVGWRVRLEPARVRVFVEGRASMLPGLVEVIELPRDIPFFIAFDDTAAGPLGEWLKSDCEGWTPLRIVGGLPPGWTFGTVTSASSDHGISEVRPGLGRTDRISMRLVGGIRSSGANTFFSFAPPRLAIDGASATNQVQVAGQPVKPIPGSSATYGLPDDLPTDARIGLEVLDGDEVVRRSSLYLVSGMPWRFGHPPVTVDQFGDQADGGRICGAVVPAPTEGCLPHDLLRTPGLDSGGERIYFVGRHRGEIAVWPDEPIPGWEAVWAVPFRRRGRALFCGSSLAGAGPSREWVGGRSQRKLWHNLLWRRRSKITPPSDPAQRSLWLRYRSSARDC